MEKYMIEQSERYEDCLSAACPEPEEGVIKTVPAEFFSDENRPF